MQIPSEVRQALLSLQHQLNRFASQIKSLSFARDPYSLTVVGPLEPDLETAKAEFSRALMHAEGMGQRFDVLCEQQWDGSFQRSHWTVHVLPKP